MSRIDNRRNVAYQRVLNHLDQLPGKPDWNDVLKYLGRSIQGLGDFKKDWFPNGKIKDYKNSRGKKFVTQLFLGFGVPPSIFGYEEDELTTRWTPSLSKFYPARNVFSGFRQENHAIRNNEIPIDTIFDCIRTACSSIYAYDRLDFTGLNFSENYFCRYKNRNNEEFVKSSQHEHYSIIQDKLAQSDDFLYKRFFKIRKINLLDHDLERHKYENSLFTFFINCSIETFEHILFCNNLKGAGANYEPSSNDRCLVPHSKVSFEIIENVFQPYTLPYNFTIIDNMYLITGHLLHDSYPNGHIPLMENLYCESNLIKHNQSIEESDFEKMNDSEKRIHELEVFHRKRVQEEIKRGYLPGGSHNSGSLIDVHLKFINIVKNGEGSGSIDFSEQMFEDAFEFVDYFRGIQENHHTDNILSLDHLRKEVELKYEIYRSVSH